MNDRPRVWTVFVGFAVAFVALQVASALVLSAWAWATMPAASGPDGFVARLESLIASPPGLAVAAIISSSGLGALALLGAAMSPERWRLRLRLTLEGLTAGRVLAVVIGVLAVSQALDSLITLLGLQRFGALDHINRVVASATGPWLAVMAVALALGPGIAEELFFRGFMQTRLSGRFGPAAAIAVTSACFGFLHFDLVHTPVAAGLGVVLGWAAERTRSVVPGIVAHVVNNLIAVLTARVPLPASTAIQAAILVACLVVMVGAIVVVSRVPRGPQLR